MKRYVIQETSISGFVHYEIIDTENNCDVVYSSQNYNATVKEYNSLSDEEKICSHCGKYMTDGFMVIGDYGFGWEYYCEEDCLHSVYTEKEYLQMYEEDLAFWTTF